MRPATFMSVMLAAGVPAGVSATDTLIGSLEATQVAPGNATGESLAIDWVHQAPAGHVYTAGFEHRRMDTAGFDTAQAGVNVVLGSRYRLGLQLRGGGISEPGARISSWKESLELSYRTFTRVYVGGQLQHLDVGDLRGSIATVSTDLALPPHWALRLAIAQSIEGNIASHHVLMRTDYFGALHLFGGMATGASAARLLDFKGAARGNFTDFYFGAGQTFGKTSVTLSLRRLKLTGQSQDSVNLMVTVPLPDGARH